MGALDDKTCVVTGATRGFGYAIAAAYLAEGARVMICGRSHEGTGLALERLRTEMGAVAADHLKGMACDTADFDQVAKLAERAAHHFERIDVWVNNAAVSAPFGEVETVPRELFEQAVQINILGYYYGTLVALRDMTPRRSGKIINIAGLGADGKPAAFQSPYAPTKAWVQSFTRSVALEHKDDGVGLFVLNPGMMLTDMVMRLSVSSARAEARLARFPTVLCVLAQEPHVPARRAVWLASSATDGKTGLVVRELKPRKAARLLLRYGFRRLRGRGEAPAIDVSRCGSAAREQDPA